MCIGIEFIMMLEAVEKIMSKYGKLDVKTTETEIRVSCAGFKDMSAEDIEALESVHMVRDGNDWTYDPALLETFGRKP